MNAEVLVDQAAAELLATHRIMAISTVRPDGWPQTTIVGYVNDGLTIYFMVFRNGQKLANIAAEPRISIAIGDEPPDIHLARALYAAALASEVTDPEERIRVWELLKRRHGNLVGRPMPDLSAAAIMKATCEHLSVVDYTKGLGHTDAYDLTEAGS